MKVTVNREAFLEVFQVAGSVCPSRSPKPVLENVRIEVTEQVTALFATNMEIGMRLEVPNVTFQKPGTALLPVSRLAPFLRESADETIMIESTDDKITVKGKHSVMKLQARNPDEFPVVPGFEDTSYFSLKSSALKQMIKKTAFATDVDSGRFALGGVLVDIEEDKMNFVATDGRRLARVFSSYQKVGNPHVEPMTIIPTASINLIERSLPNDESEVHISIRANDLVVRNKNSVIYTRLVEGRFPRWRDVYPVNRANVIRLQLPAGHLESAIRQAVVVAESESRGVDFEFTEGNLVLQLVTANVGDCRIELPITYSGEPIRITIDYRYFLDFLRVLNPEENFTVEIENPDRAVLCHTEDGYGYLIMPLARE